MPEEKIYDVEALAEYLKMKPQTIRRLLSKGIIKGVKPAKQWLVRQSSIDKYFEEEERKAGKE